MLRHLLTGIGILEFAAPRRIIRAAEGIAFENPGEGRLRRWTIPMARLEALVFIWAGTRRRGPPAVARPLLAGLGLAMALVPRSALEFGLRVAYENPDDIEVKPWLGPLTRALGVVYLVAALAAGRADAPASTEKQEGEDTI
ncbi:uncharacterized protein Nmag_1946 [Natrialba magadii ATCC 43099]|uniref:Uncharacterized protein n=1 Tax=Natrialba magadii (strain ATCC 43099 / DSM 3394 / CCM 3739 / CIP 104546 / IAM 13178 / JCM 8861 / NBRC 102185 / NCIMB 2190 / MS3) TaxID=547559 RepID=D3SVA9_NATMM|nr:hypothetical protein [Natrialba magadii]ADD05517.1 uncharacterized protein Nmag_1946 [Natrialba magadii ATCC 43099]ELY29520.1 hypothetical protein C500_10663 [Natrialba magadii ATCC 43099]